MTTTKAPDVLHFRGSITRSLTWLSTLRSDGYPSPRKTRFWLLAQLCQTGLITRRVPTKGFRVRGSFSFPKLSWRKVILVYGPGRVAWFLTRTPCRSGHDSVTTMRSEYGTCGSRRFTVPPAAS